jgi:hypothetical protein
MHEQGITAGVRGEFGSTIGPVSDITTAVPVCCSITVCSLVPAVVEKHVIISTTRVNNENKDLLFID